MNKMKSWIKEHILFTVGIAILVIMLISAILLASIGSNTNENDSMTVSEYQYIEKVNEVILIYIDTVSIMEIITIGTIDGSISYYEASVLFESALKVFSVLKITSNEMVVPYDYIEYHEHIKNALIYTEEATSLMIYGYRYVDTDLLEEAMVIINLASSEFEKATLILVNF